MVSSGPSFTNPPVSEVVCGVSFKRITGFSPAHIGLLWALFRDAFPRAELAPLLRGDDTEMPPEMDFAALMFPRTWFIHHDECHLIQVQQDRFLFNWRRMKDENLYPRFPAIYDAFRGHLATFTKFLSENELGSPELRRMELTYLNNMPIGEAWKSTDEIGMLFPDFKWRTDSQRFLPPPSLLGWRMQFALPQEDSTMVVRLSSGTRRADQTPSLVLDLTVKGELREQCGDLDEWFQLAHDWIVNGFIDLTNPEVQRSIWGRQA